MMRRAFLFTLFATACWGCKDKYKDSEPRPTVSEVPRIELVSVNPATVHQLQDSIVFTIRYTDGNGDLGFAHADSTSVELIDTRFPLTFHYHLQPLSPQNTSLAITGILPIVLNNTILFDANSAEETAVFNIRLRDRAGNWSNTLVTTPVVVKP